MSDDANTSEIIQAQAVDYLATGARAALNAIPFAGSLLAERADSIIPNQCVDRIADLATKLEERIADLEKIAVNILPHLLPIVIQQKSLKIQR